jgi:hypothetical protein
MSDQRLVIGDRPPIEPFDGLGLTTSAHDWWLVVLPAFARFGRGGAMIVGHIIQHCGRSWRGFND